jgi:hypothetical protein
MADEAKRIIIRYDTSQNWTQYNPILADGEMGIEFAAHSIRIKIGRDDLPWSALEYAVDEKALLQAIAVEVSRAQAAEGVNATAITDEVSRAQAAESALDSAITDEVSRAQAAEGANATAIAAEVSRAQAAEGANATAITAINAKIPAQASSSNQVADKNFVNSSIQSVTAFPVYKDPQKANFLTKQELIEATEAYYANGDEVSDFTNNYTIIISDESAPAPFTGGQTRYKFSGATISTYGFEYGINETPFTSAQNEAINSGITAELIGKYDAYETEKLGADEIEEGYTPVGTVSLSSETQNTGYSDSEDIAIYIHYIKIEIEEGANFVLWFGSQIMLDDAAPFTPDTFWDWLAQNNFTAVSRAYPINGRYTANQTSSLDAGAMWINATVTQVSIITIASTGIATQTIELAGKTITVDDFVQPVPFTLTEHRHTFTPMVTGNFSGVADSKVIKKI